ncbi:hypothetical protein [Streptomyces rubiginosohelvolus]|uniref:hypothetical protein n=1 Tax=Streptomyces rubiginosohelvolus TaxID=67362 RepID=UPI0035DEC0DD
MNGPRVLVVGRECRVVAAVVRAVRGHGVAAVGATADADALREIDAGPVALLVLGAGVEPASRELLRRRTGEGAGRVVETPLRGGDIEEYVRREILGPLRAGPDSG